MNITSRFRLTDGEASLVLDHIQVVEHEAYIQTVN